MTKTVEYPRISKCCAIDHNIMRELVMLPKKVIGDDYDLAIKCIDMVKP